MQRPYISAVFRFLLFAAWLLVVPTAFAGTLDRDVAHRIDEALQAEMQEQQAVGLAVGVIVDNEIVYLKGYGFANLEQKTPVDTNTMFRWASISKPITAIAALQLWEQGKLDLDADVRRYVNEFPDKSAVITPRQLLCHQGGIVHYSNGQVIRTQREYDVPHPFADVTLALDTFKESPLVAAPGEKFSYSTHGYILLSAVVERAGRQPFIEQVRERIIKPLGMQTLQPDYQWKEIPNRAHGYRQLLGVVTPSTDTDVSWKLGGGGFISNIEDLAKFAQGLLTGKLVAKTTEPVMWTPQTTANGEATEYGLGFRVKGQSDSNDFEVSHSGSQEKTKTNMVFYPRQKLGVVVMCNSEQVSPTKFSDRVSAALADVAVTPKLPPVPTGKENPQLASFDNLLTEFIAKHDIPGASLAVTRHGKLVYARGYGYADLEALQPVQPTSLFRIASISKPITAVAVLQLVEQHRLSLDDRVFEVLPVEPHFAGRTAVDPRLKKVTIRQLLHHTGGWDRGKSFDPMFQHVRFAKALGTQPPNSAEHIMRFMWGQELDFNPGEQYAYSNFGYCLLGRVIEKISGQSYEEYVKANVLKPLGIHTMQIGKTRLDERVANEVKYYAYQNATGPAVVGPNIGAEVPAPYGVWYQEVMDSHGAWIASAVDLARFAAAFDDPAHCPLLKPTSIATMFHRPEGAPGYKDDGTPKERYYACGWSVRFKDDSQNFNAWHTGSLPGTSTLLVRRHDGLNWAVLFNRRKTPHASHAAGTIDPLVHGAAAAEVTAWPETDLFDDYR